MTEADVWRALIGVIRSGLDAQGKAEVAIKQSFQPEKQGANTQDTVYLFKVTSKRVGHQGKRYDYNSSSNNFDGTENYWLEATYQLSALVERNINDSSSTTAYDLVDLCGGILQTYDARKKLLESGIGMGLIGEIRNPYDLDDREQFDQGSSFDLTLTYNQTISSIVPIADPIDADIKRV